MPTIEGAAPRGAGLGSSAIGVLRAASAVKDTETVVIGADTYEVDTHDVATITAGRIRLDLHGGTTAKATGVLTFSDVALDGETVTINGKIYTFQTVLTNVDGNVLIGANAAASIANLRAAILGAAGAGTLYAAATPAHTTVTVSASDATTLTVQAKQGGTPANAYGTTESLTNAAWGGATMSGGVDPTAAEFTTALTAAINTSGTEKVTAVRVSANEVLVYSSNARGDATPVARADALTLTETLTGANNAWDTAAMRGGRAVGTQAVSVQQRVPNAQEVALGNMHFVFPFTPTSVIVRVVTTATPGVAKAWDGGATVTGNRVTLDNGGATDWAATDTVQVTVTGA